MMRKRDGRGKMMKYVSAAARKDAWLSSHLWNADTRSSRNVLGFIFIFPIVV